MNRSHSILTFGAMAATVFLAGGCAGKIDIAPNEFVARYTSNIEVPNPSDPSLPSREFRGAGRGYCLMEDIIPSSQGGGAFGKRIVWRCPVAGLPRDFPDAYRPGDAILDSRPGSRHTYMIESYAPPVSDTEFPPPTASAPAQTPQE